MTKHLSDAGLFSLESTIHFIGPTHILKTKETLNFPLCSRQRKQGDLPACLFRQERGQSGGKKPHGAVKLLENNVASTLLRLPLILEE